MRSLEAPRQVLDIEVAGGVGEGLQIAGAVEQLVLQRKVTEQRGGDRLTLLNDRFGEGAVVRPSAGVTTSGTPPRSRNAAPISCPRSCAFAAFVANSSTHGFVAGLHLSSLRDLRLGVGELVQRAQLSDELLGGRVGHCSPHACCVGVLGSQGTVPRSRVGGSPLGFRWKQRFASHVRWSGRPEHRSLVLPALSRCAIPHEMVTTERVAKSHSIIRSSLRGCGAHVAMSAWGGRPARLVGVRRILSGANLRGGQTRDGV